MNKTDEAWIRTYTGVHFTPLNPRVEDVNIEDIAHALSNICRFTGHCRRFYSVAEHCLNVSYKVPRAYALRALLHDASEAYICDVARPLKYTEEFAGYREIEARLEEVIFEKFGVGGEPHPSIKEADHRMLATEKRYLMSKDPDYYGPHVPYENYPLVGWHPHEIEAIYLDRLSYLTRRTNEL